MALLNKFLPKLSVAAATSVATFLAVGTIGTVPAQAALFKFSFTGNGANGYIIYDNSTAASLINPLASSYESAVTNYYLDTNEGVFQGTTSNLVIYLASPTSNNNTIQLEVRGAERQPTSQFDLFGYFAYPNGTFNGSTALPTTVPSTATAAIYPNADYPRTQGTPAFTGTVQTQIQEVPEPSSLFGIWVVGAWFMLTQLYLIINKKGFTAGEAS